MRHFPVFADLTDRACLVVGAGEVGHRRVELLLEAGARVTVLAPEISPALWPLAAEGRIRIEQRAFDESALDPYWLVVAATNEATVNARVAAAAAAAKRFCNVVDDRALSSFIVPAIIERDPITVTVSTAGASPVLARWIKGLIETTLPVRIGSLARLLESFRARVKGAIRDTTERRRFWESIVTSEAATHELAGRGQASRDAFERILDAWTSASTRPLHGEAFIVGAGPGAPDLITLRGRQLLAAADVVLYDRLVAPEVLSYARRDAQLVCVGKSPGTITITQAEITARLIELVRAGHRVCRLKGGDPMVFGRVAEEIEALAQAALPFQIVPGVSAVEGCAAYAGIPLTWRGVAQSVLITTGHTEHGELGDFAAGGVDRTIAVYMAARRSKPVAQALIDGGLPSGTPVAIIENGTRETQRVSRTTLGSLTARVNDRVIETPALLLVGRVVERSQAFSWFLPSGIEDTSDAKHESARVS